MMTHASVLTGLHVRVLRAGGTGAFTRISSPPPLMKSLSFAAIQIQLDEALEHKYCPLDCNGVKNEICLRLGDRNFHFLNWPLREDHME